MTGRISLVFGFFVCYQDLMRFRFKFPNLSPPLLFSLFFAGIFFFSSSPAQAKEKPANFVFIFCDNLGYGDIEPFGSKIHRTPCLNRMAREGRKFTHFYVTAGVCTPSRASAMTGCYSQRVGMHLNERDYHVLRPVSPYGLNPKEVTVAERLKEKGYATAIIGKWHLGDQPVFLPTRQGFDWYLGIPYSDDMTARVWNRDQSKWPPLPLLENETVIEAPVDRDGLTKRYTERALDWIEKNRHNPFFLYLPQAMPGSTPHPYSSEKFKGKSANGPWGDSVEELDWSLGQILDKLVESKLAQNTLVIWTSDNGAPCKPPPDLSRGSNLPLHGRGYTTAEGAFRVPMIAWQPGSVPPGTECGELCSSLDLFPTFDRLAGGEPISDGVKRDGYDITHLLTGKGEQKSPCDAFYYYYLDQLQAIRSGPWKLFLPLDNFVRHPHFGPKDKPSPALLFHVVDDIACKNNLAAEHPEVVKRLLALAKKPRSDLGDKDSPGPGIRPPGKVDLPKPLLLP